MDKNRREILTLWYRERILDLTFRLEDAILNGMASEYIKEMEESRSRFELLLEELLNADEDELGETQNDWIMTTYDFMGYFDRIKAAETDEARQAVRQERADYVASLSETEQLQFKVAYEVFMKAEIERFRRMADQAEAMFGVKRAAWTWSTLPTLTVWTS